MLCQDDKGNWYVVDRPALRDMEDNYAVYYCLTDEYANYYMPLDEYERYENKGAFTLAFYLWSQGWMRVYPGSAIPCIWLQFGNYISIMPPTTARLLPEVDGFWYIPSNWRYVDRLY